MFSPAVLRRILAAWLEVGYQRNYPGMRQSVPAEKDLEELLTIAFLASIEREEGNPVSFRMVYYPEITGTALGQQWSDSLPFSEAVPLTVAKVAKLSPSLDQSLGALAVSRNAAGELVILGVLFYRPRRTTLDGIESGSTIRPQALTLSVRQPGSVILSFGDHIVGRFERGNFLISRSDPLQSARLTGVFTDVISRHELFVRFTSAYSDLYLQCLCRLYQSAARHGHGSTLLWYPSAFRQQVCDRLEAGTRIVATPDLQRLMRLKLERQELEKRARTGDGQAELEHLSQRLSGLLDSMGRLSCIDGALVFNEYFEIERFGCVLTVPPWDGRVIDTSDEGSSEIQLSNYGTRHRSAIAMVGAIPRLVAVVVSEDGPIRIMTRCHGENYVSVWPDCRDAVFLD